MNDASELHELAHDLGQIGRHAYEPVKRAVSKAALSIKDDWNAMLATDSPGMRLYGTGKSVTYDLNTNVGNLGMSLLTGGISIEAEIGPEVGRKGTQGPMAGWFETGSVDGVPETKPGDRAAKANEQKFVDYIETAADEVLRSAL